MQDFKSLLENFYEGHLQSGVFTTTNENGENVVVRISDNILQTRTAQKNGWIRVNVYYNDEEHTVEEEYEI